MEIRNEVKNFAKDVEKKKFVIRNATDSQRAKLEKLMKNPDKEIIIPEIPKEKDFSNAIPTFVRNVMGSSAGAGSGEFHVYRHLRRKEYARQKHMQEKTHKEQLDDDFQEKREQNRLDSEAKTAKKRAKRLKKKQKAKERGGKKSKIDTDKQENDNDEDESESEGERSGDKSEAETATEEQNEKANVNEKNEDEVAESNIEEN
uniref:Putative prkr-interacting protein 1 n=1 Tax=Corethrella appendiculata TaxID=1370023 RepID=U5ETX0_9DIPT